MPSFEKDLGDRRIRQRIVIRSLPRPTHWNTWCSGPMSESGPMAKLVRKKKWSDGRTGPVAGRSDRLTGTVLEIHESWLYRS